MSVMIKCTCGKQFGVMERNVGKKGRCPHCGAVIMLEPAPGSAPTASQKQDKKPAADAAAASKAAPAPAKPDRAASTPSNRPAKAPAQAAAVRKNIDVDDLVQVRSGPAAVSATGEVDNTSQMAGIRHVVQRFCPTCGARYNENQARCSNCHAPLSAEEIAAAEAAKKPPLIPWLPQFYLSPGAKRGVIVVGILALLGIVYLFFRPALNRMSRLQTELRFVETTLTNAKLTSEPLGKLSLDMPGFPWNRPATVKALGQWERRVGAGMFPTAGSGTYNLESRELVLASAEGLQYRAVAPPLLHMAARAGDIGLVRKLLKEGANIDERDAQGATALHAAAAADGDQVDIVKLLLDAGANMAVTDNRGLTPSAMARAHKNQKVVRAMGGGPALDPKI